MKNTFIPALLLLLLPACSKNSDTASVPSPAPAPAATAPTSPPVQTSIQAASPIKNVSVEEAAKLLESKKDLIILDIRTPEEFSRGHLAGATNINFNGPDFEERVTSLDKSKPYLVHCAAGGRSGRSLETFKKLEFKNILHLDAGFQGWQKAGKPIAE